MQKLGVLDCYRLSCLPGTADTQAAETHADKIFEAEFLVTNGL